MLGSNPSGIPFGNPLRVKKRLGPGIADRENPPSSGGLEPVMVQDVGIRHVRWIPDRNKYYHLSGTYRAMERGSKFGKHWPGRGPDVLVLSH